MYRLTRGFAIIAVLTFLLTASSRAVEFASPVTYAVGANPNSLVTGDFNGDGKLDLAVLNTGSNTISILLGNGDGTFQSAKTVASGANTSGLSSGELSSIRLELGDFNGDGKLDLVVEDGAAGQIFVLFGNGDGTFQAPVATTLPVNSPQCCTGWQVAIGDFNGDKKADVIVGIADIFGNISLQILLGNGDGTFQNGKPLSPSGTLATTCATGACTGVAIADFNKDGKLDLAVGVVSGVELLAGQGDGTFADLGPIVPVAGGAVGTLRVADINADGYPDLIVDTGVSGTSAYTHDIGVLLNNGSGGFHSEQVFVSTGGPHGYDDLSSAVVFGDFNGDGKLDVAIGSDYEPSLRVLLGMGDGTFATPIPFDSPGPLAAAGNFNGDKLTDLVIYDFVSRNTSQSYVDILLNDSPASGTDLAIVTSNESTGAAAVNTTVTYTADVMNEGPQDASGVTFTDTLPSGVSFVSGTASQGSCSAASSVVTCSIGSLADTSEVQITVVVTTNTLGSFTNNMGITGNEPDGATANNAASQILAVLPTYTLTVTKSGNGSGTVTVSGDSGTVNCGSTCSVTVLSGDVGGVQATPDPGSLLQSWGGACTGTPSNQGCFLKITSDTSASVTFGLAPSFTITAASSSLSTSGGATVTDVVTFTPQGGFTDMINLTCSVTGPVPLPTCGLSPTSLAGGGNSTLTITAPSRNAILRGPAIPLPRGFPFAVLGLLAAFAMLLLTMPRNSAVPPRRAAWLLGASMAASVLILCSCGGSSSPPPPQSYNVTVTATSGAISKTFQIQLTAH
jgi:uncharacterized repeat protein (TIGR01451 family)